MSVERGIRFDLIARLCPNTTGAELRSVATEVCIYLFIFDAICNRLYRLVCMPFGREEKSQQNETSLTLWRRWSGKGPSFLARKSQALFIPINLYIIRGTKQCANQAYSPVYQVYN
jgi:hypothetical protein